MDKQLENATGSKDSAQMDHALPEAMEGGFLTATRLGDESGQNQAAANASAPVQQLKSMQAAANSSPQVRQLKSVQSAANQAVQRKQVEGGKGSLPAQSSAPIQRVIAYENPINDGEADTIAQLRNTVAGLALVNQINDHEKTCSIHWAATRVEEMYAEPADPAAAKDPRRGSNVRVNIPRIEGAGAGDKYQHTMVDGGGHDKMPAVVVAHHELTHALGAMGGIMESGEDKVVHSVFNNGVLVRKETIPMEEIVTMGLRDGGTFTHLYHDLATGADLSQTVAEKMLARGTSENALRAELGYGRRDAYVSNPDVVPPSDIDRLTASARLRIKAELDECKASVISVRAYSTHLATKRATLSAFWQRQVDAAPGRVAAWLQEVANQEATSMQPLIANISRENHNAWETRVRTRVAYIQGRNAIFTRDVLRRWATKYMANR